MKPHVRRYQQTRPGWDCRASPCGKYGCTDKNPGVHGVGDDKWVYAISDGFVAVELSVGSNVYPATVPVDRDARAPHGQFLKVCAHFPIERADVATDAKMKPCPYMGTCFNADFSALDADAFFKEHGTPTYDQPESFWDKLTELWRERAQELHKQRKDTVYGRCVHCDGTGTVPVAKKVD